MSNAVFPTLPGLAWNVTRRPTWSTLVKQSVSGREYRAQQYSAPLWRYKLTFEFLRASTAYPELQQLLAFFNARAGSFDSWLYADPDDSVAVLQPFGSGNGTAVAFQLVRSLGGYTESVVDLAGAPQVYVGGVLQTAGTHYTINGAGLVTFTTAPGAGVSLTWSGSYYWRCRFLQDQTEMSKFAHQLWELRTLEFTTIKA